jgi:hypothetical protein
VVKGFLTVHHHFDRAFDSEFNNPGEWNRASYTPDILAEIGEALSPAAENAAGNLSKSGGRGCRPIAISVISGISARNAL